MITSYDQLATIIVLIVTPIDLLEYSCHDSRSFAPIMTRPMKFDSPILFSSPNSFLSPDSPIRTGAPLSLTVGNPVVNMSRRDREVAEIRSR